MRLSGLSTQGTPHRFNRLRAGARSNSSQSLYWFWSFLLHLRRFIIRRRVNQGRNFIRSVYQRRGSDCRAVTLSWQFAKRRTLPVAFQLCPPLHWYRKCRDRFPHTTRHNECRWARPLSTHFHLWNLPLLFLGRHTLMCKTQRVATIR